MLHIYILSDFFGVGWSAGFARGPEQPLSGTLETRIICFFVHSKLISEKPTNRCTNFFPVQRNLKFETPLIVRQIRL